MKYRSIILFSSLFFLSDVYAGSEQTYQFYLHSLTPPRASHILLKSSDRLMGVLGLGWSTDNDSIVGECFWGSVEHVGTPSGSISMDTVYNYDDVMSQLNFKSDGNFSLAGFNLTSNINYLHILQDTDYTKTFIYLATIYLKNRRFVPPKTQSPLTWIGQQYAKDPVAFRANCGDKFIAEQKIGGALYIAVKFHFRTKREKSQFLMSVKSSFASLGGLNANLDRITNAMERGGSISVTAFQIGGDPTKLGKILGAKSGTTEASVMSCNFNNLKSCSNYISQVLNYATIAEDGGFPSQFKEDNINRLTGPGVLGNILQNTSTIVPVKIASTLVNQKIAKARRIVSKKYEDSLRQINAINDIINSGNPFSSDYIRRLQTLKITAKHNSEILKNAGQACYEGNLSKCLIREKALSDLTTEIDLTPFERKFIVIADAPAAYLLPYSDNQLIYGSRDYYEPSQIFTIKTFTSRSISLELPTKWIRAQSNDNGFTYRGTYYNRSADYTESMTLIPDF